MEILKKIIRFIVLLPINFYRYLISPFTPASCRHVPTCSQYAVQAVQQHGILKGFWLGTKRLAKCHPWGTSGYDPVPPAGIKIYKFKQYKVKNKPDES